MPKIPLSQSEDINLNPILFKVLKFLTEKPDTALGLEKRKIGTKRANNYYLLTLLKASEYVEIQPNEKNKKIFQVNYNKIIDEFVNYIIENKITNEIYKPEIYIIPLKEFSAKLYENKDLIEMFKQAMGYCNENNDKPILMNVFAELYNICFLFSFHIAISEKDFNGDKYFKAFMQTIFNISFKNKAGLIFSMRDIIIKK